MMMCVVTDADRGEATKPYYLFMIAHLEEAKIEALSPPKQERATAKGIVQFMTPNTWSANV